MRVAQNVFVLTTQLKPLGTLFRFLVNVQFMLINCMFVQEDVVVSVGALELDWIKHQSACVISPGPPTKARLSK